MLTHIKQMKQTKEEVLTLWFASSLFCLLLNSFPYVLLLASCLSKSKFDNCVLVAWFKIAI